ncbi:MAG: GNAT family N-acetyltransferase [Oscillospiraceae bacterium]|nr:GNAT family N-acetyltransferase [Oscillospiraceae bacterium]
MKHTDILITDFTNPYFQSAFRSYYADMGERVNNWVRCFENMNKDGDNLAYIRLSEENEAIGFIQFKIICLKNWFFEERLGFIREFWVDSNYRRKGHGSELLAITENYFLSKKVYKAILTTDTAEVFYINKGYEKDSSIIADNQMDVFVKQLRV